MHALADAAQSGGAGNIILGFVIIIVSIAAYFAPSIVALARHVPNTGSVIVIDLLAGWTVIGWIVALAMACRSQYAPPPEPPRPAPLRQRGSNGF